MRLLVAQMAAWCVNSQTSGRFHKVKLTGIAGCPELEREGGDGSEGSPSHLWGAEIGPDVETKPWSLPLSVCQRPEVAASTIDMDGLGAGVCLIGGGGVERRGYSLGGFVLSRCGVDLVFESRMRTHQHIHSWGVRFPMVVEFRDPGPAKSIPKSLGRMNSPQFGFVTFGIFATSRL